mgnify:CR=1 FL=1
MADYLQLIDNERLVSIGNDFDYLEAVDGYIGFKLFPAIKTENIKLAVADLTEKGKVPVMALIHALDTEARIGDRPDPEGVNYELFLIKEKLNQGEALKKLLRNGMLNPDKQAMLERIYNDAANLISRVLTRVEAMTCELLSTAKLTIAENNVAKVVDYGLPATHRMTVQSWGTPATDILADLKDIQKRAKNKIVRAITTSKVMGYIQDNTAINALAAVTSNVASLIWVKEFMLKNFGIEFIVYDGTYKLSAQNDTEYYFLKEDVITFLTTDEVLGRTFFTYTPEEDFEIVSRLDGYVAVTQEKTFDPAGIWTKASAVAFPCPADINQMFICTVQE